MIRTGQTQDRLAPTYPAQKEELLQRELQGQTKKLEEVLTMKNEKQMATLGTVRREMRNP